MKHFLGLIILLTMVSTAIAQGTGSLNVSQDSRIETLLSKQRSLYYMDSSFSGYRIHIFMEIGNEALKHAQEVKKRF